MPKTINSTQWKDLGKSFITLESTVSQLLETPYFPSDNNLILKEWPLAVFPIYLRSIGIYWKLTMMVDPIMTRRPWKLGKIFTLPIDIQNEFDHGLFALFDTFVPYVETSSAVTVLTVGFVVNSSFLFTF